LIKTLYSYLSRDLVRVTLLTLVALTLIMTVFAIIEPLRKQGLGGEQVLSLIAYTLPFALTITMPIAALFAATIVYGRFAQDNELMACRASGLGSLTLLRPAFALGLVVTVLSLVLSNLVSPYMLMRSERLVTDNIAAITYNKLRNEKYVSFQGRGIRAERVNEEEGYLEGVVLVDTTRSGTQMLSARGAYMRIEALEEGGPTFVTVRLIDPVFSPPGTDVLVQESSQLVEPYQLPLELEDEPEWYSLDKLLRALNSPIENAKVRSALRRVRMLLRNDLLVQDVMSSINAGESYALTGPEGQYVISAAAAEPERRGVRLAPGGPDQRVTLTIEHDGQSRTIAADSGFIETANLLLQSDLRVTLRLSGNVESVSGPRMPTRESWATGQIPVPGSITDRAAAVDLADIYRQPELFTQHKGTAAVVDDLRINVIPRVLAEVRAELHARLAYSLSGLLLVVLGAALGIVFRGGQVVTAFGLSMLPAFVVIVLIQMGKQMAGNPQVLAQQRSDFSGATAGVAIIWGGIALLALGNLVMYAYMRRR
jgi:lipopolysaccharide export LptBFGC system permease protein LptF